ncbi:MAG: tripartite tricarboxylate transporter TctB family protein [Vannielia sp.]|uniref:tripartite tricarboxylate transporter TctB family protein n=1 Tax=Vannielia sp. TaxID=2813045 RepID=UPI003B8CFCC6
MRQVMWHLSGRAGHLLLLAGFAAYALWYALDAWAAQAKAQNMLLIGPAAVLAGAVIALISIREILRWRAGEPIETAEDAQDLEPAAPSADGDSRSFREAWGTPLSAALLGVYVLAMPLLGFDVATVLYIALCMILQGARDWRIIAGFSLVAGLLPVWAIEKMLSIPVPTLFL